MLVHSTQRDGITYLNFSAKALREAQGVLILILMLGHSKEKKPVRVKRGWKPVLDENGIA